MHLKKPNKAGILKLSDDCKELTFDYKDGIIDFVGGASRFTVRRDLKTGLYVTFSNYVTEGAKYPTCRNLLCMAVSEDLRNWRRVKDVLKDESGLPPEYSAKLTGFQYPAWQFDGDDDGFNDWIKTGAKPTKYKTFADFYKQTTVILFIKKEY